ncbi:hypothetical protein QQS21_011278 [Conoideocrella luteorostrata]|uniref:Putative transcription factor kapC n=1 Tax=Conoideocrella luteorostrata TaxID=1105319 RepID=A0AAJ0CG41_9HYPO|nr:hypothetical protein QQS21_011278 [Conoideocrella luteorostrata]
MDRNDQPTRQSTAATVATTQPSSSAMTLTSFPATEASIPTPWLDLLDTNEANHQYGDHQFPGTGFIHDPNFLPYAYTSPTSTASEPSVLPQPREPQNETPRPSRRRENRYRNAPPGVLSRRRAQNRASQRAYRERKEQRIRDLELLLEEANRREQTLSNAYVSLQTEYERLRIGHEGNSSMPHTLPIPDDMPLLPDQFDPAMTQNTSDMASDFSFTPDMYEYNYSNNNGQP